MSEPPVRPQIRMLAQQPAGGLYCVEAMIRYHPARLGQKPIKLAPNIGNEIVRLADTHAPEGALRFRARCRIPLKSALVSGVADIGAPGISGNSLCIGRRIG